ncbi:MAG: GntR family transcriptional regulator [Hungatella hathewayi]
MKSQSVKELVYEGILNDILQGVYPANSILNERMLTEKYQVSKTPVREALVQLCSEGILKNIPRFGYQLPVITPAEINGIIEYRMMLECAALEKTIRIITNDEIDALVAHATSAVKLSQQKDITVQETNMEFHDAVQLP